MNLKKIGIGAAAIASAATLGFAGTANASAIAAAPTANYQVCGNVYSDASFVSNGAPPAAANGINNVWVQGTLSSTGATWKTQTDSEGRYCITGDAAMADDVSFGGATVRLEVLDTPANPLPAGVTVPNKVQWPSIGALTFLTHKVSGLDSARYFNFTGTQ